MITQNAYDALLMLDNCLAQVLLNFDKESHDNAAARAWLIKKGRTHPHCVWTQMRNLLQQAEITADVEKHGVAREKLEVIALLHDLGRLHEINPENGKFQKTQDVCACSHGDLSAQMLQRFGEDDCEILLPIKYHDRYNCHKNLFADADYRKLPDYVRERVYFMWRLLTDADRLGNFSVLAKVGLQGTSELLNPKLYSYAKISPEVQQAVMNDSLFSDGSDWRQTYADVWVVFIDMIGLLHFDYSRKLFIKAYLPAIQDFLLRELKQAPATDCERAEAFAFLERFYEKINKDYIRS